MEDICPDVSLKSEKSKANITTTLIEQLRVLTTLNVSSYNITDQGADMIATVLQEAVSLTKLDLSNAMLNSFKAVKIITALKNISSLEVFKINSNDIDDGASDSIAAVISNSSLKEIDLSHNKFSLAGVLNVTTAISEFSNIKKINISSNFIVSDNTVALTTALSKYPVLQEFNFSQNLLRLHDILTIAQVFRHHPTLQTLDLSGNNISFSPVAEFIVDVILSVNQPLVNLNVCGRNIRPRCIDNKYSSPVSSENSSTTFSLSNLYSFKHSSVGNQTNFIKVVEACPIYSDDIISYYVDHLGGVFYNQYHNFALVIPPGAVSLGDCVEIQGTANHFGPYIIPDGFYPISSYFWVSANYEFKIAVYFIMSHYAKIRSLEDINYLHVLHHCTQNHSTTSSRLTLNTICDGVYFDSDIGYCVLATNHFCSYCQAKSIESIPEYLSAYYCTYDEHSSESCARIAEVSFCPPNYECKKVMSFCSM